MTQPAPAAKGGARLFGSAIAVPKADHGPGGAQPGNLRWAGRIGRECDHQRGQVAGGLLHQLKIARLHGSDQRRVMRAMAGRVQMRAFQMQPGEACHLLGHRMARGVQNTRCDLWPVGDKRGQDAGRPKRTMRGADAGKLRGVGLGADHLAAAAIDLHIYKAGHQKPLAQVGHG